VRKAQAGKRVREITTKFVSERSECEQRELEALIFGSAEGRQAYIEAMLLDAYLFDFFENPNIGT